MLRGFAAGLVALALVASPAAAGNVTGWYAGIYAGAAKSADVTFGYETFGAYLLGGGTEEFPSSFVNDNGIDGRLFDFLNLGPRHYSYASAGEGGGALYSGALELLASPALGVVVGYGLGNGIRIEGDLSAASFGGGRYAFQSGTGVGAVGGIDGSGVWTWTQVDEMDLGPLPPAGPLEDIGFVYSTDVQFLLVNAFYDIGTGTSITPYLGGGLGIARVTGTLDDLCGCMSGGQQVRLTPAAQLGGGVRFALSDPVSLDIGYRFKLAASPDFHWLDDLYDGNGAYAGFGASQSGIIGVHTLQAGISFALR